MADRRSHSSRVQRIVKAGEALIQADRMAGIIRLLEAEGFNLPASDVWPSSFSASSRSKNLAPLRPFLELHQTAANRDLIYEVREVMRGPLQRVVDALDEIAQASAGRRQVTVTVRDDDEVFLVNGEEVSEKNLAAAVKRALKNEA